MRSDMRIRAAIISSISIITFSIIIGTLIYYSAANAIVTNVSESLTQIALLGAKAVENNLKGSLEVIETIAARDLIKNPSISVKNKIEILKNEAERKGFTRMSIADMSGYALTTDNKSLYIGDREYFKIAKSGQKNISDPIESRVENNLVVTFAVPIIHEGEVIGVLYSTQDVEALSKITYGIKLGEHGRSFIIDSVGVIIAHEDSELVRES